MATFVFFGGSEAHPRSWNRCRTFLQERGHTSEVIDWTLAPWSEGVAPAMKALVRRINLSDEPPVLVGHSMAGLFLPLLGEKTGAVGEIYIAALVPHPRQSIFERLFAGEEIFEPGWTALYQQLLATPEHPSTVQEVECHLFHDGPGGPYGDYWRPFPLPLALFYDIRFPLVQRSHCRRSYIVCHRDRTVAPAWQRKAARELQETGASVTEWAAGHSPHVANPSELAALLERLAEPGRHDSGE